MRFLGGIFDIDGVLLDTPHETAWRKALEELMTGPWRALAPQTTYSLDAFTDAVYQEHVAGKPRDAGAASALAYFHVPDADGTRARTFAEAKQVLLKRLGAAGDVHVFDDALRFLLDVKTRGVHVCAASSSKNADDFLRAVSVGALIAAHGWHYSFVTDATTLLDLFDADVDGRQVARGKPAPDLFLAAAEALNLTPSCCFVVEDATAGIAAAKGGGMYAIGVARVHDVAALRAAGADTVTPRLDAIDVTALLVDATDNEDAPNQAKGAEV
jgi:beta-phosphoglucomutase-like phosphatase (HAD superfamily)